MYDIDVIGYNNTSNKLHLFDVESVDESIVEDGINFNKEDIKKGHASYIPLQHIHQESTVPHWKPWNTADKF